MCIKMDLQLIIPIVKKISLTFQLMSILTQLNFKSWEEGRNSQNIKLLLQYKACFKKQKTNLFLCLFSCHFVLESEKSTTDSKQVTQITHHFYSNNVSMAKVYSLVFSDVRSCKWYQLTERKGCGSKGQCDSLL